MKKLTIVIAAYPDLFYRVGGLQVQVSETYKSLKALGHDVYYIHEWLEYKPSIDIYHQFSMDISMLRVFEENFKVSKAVVVSPIFQKNSFVKEQIIKLINKVKKIDFVNYHSIRNRLLKANGLIFLGESEKENFEKYYNLRANSYSLIPNGIKLDYAFISSQKEDYILNVGSICKRKNQLKLIKAAKKLNIPLKIVGPVMEEYYYRQCLEEAKGYNIEFLGAKDNNSKEFVSLLSESRVFVLSSLSEVLPITVFEALACGVPVVCTSNSSVSDYIKSEYISYVSPTNEDEIIAAIDLLYNREKPMTANEIEMFQKKYTWQKVTNDIVNFYYKILDK